MSGIPDASYIREAEMYGMPPYETVKCPRCGEECETIYTDINSEVCGCENCLTEYDAWDYFDDEEDPDADAERGWQCRDD